MKLGLFVLAASLSSIAWSASASPSDGKSVVLHELSRIPARHCPMSKMALHPADHPLFVSASLRDLTLWDVNSKQSIWDIVYERRKDAPRSDSASDVTFVAQFTSTGRELLVGGDNKLDVLKTSNGSKLKSLISPDANEHSLIYVTAAISHDDRYAVASVVVDDSVNYESPAHILIWGEHSKQIAIKPVSQRIEYWNLESGKLERSLKIKDSMVREIGISPERDLIYTISFDSVNFYKFSSGKLFFSYGLAEIGKESDFPIIIAGAISNDLRFIGLSTYDHIMIIDTQSLKVIQKWNPEFPWPYRGIPIAMNFSDSGKFLEGLDSEGRLMSWNILTGKLAFRAEKVETYRWRPYGPHPHAAFSIRRNFYVEETSPDEAGGYCAGISIWSIPSEIK